jgi:hypothetical protein
MSVSPIAVNNVPTVQPPAKAGGASADHASHSAPQTVSAPTADKVTISAQALQASQKTAPDGDSPAVEAAESRATKLAEKMNNGFAPRASSMPAK